MQGFDIIELPAYRDARGWNTHPVDYALLAAGRVDNVHVVSLTPGAVRGNHLHRRQTEYIFIMGGPCVVAAAGPATGEAISLTVQAGDARLFRVAPGVAHAFKNISEGIIYALCYSELRFDPQNPDAESAPVIPAT
jgi:UDP-2-acetamido-2,6-beta-L-arabino-hexul-4-ose reductase